MTQKRKARWRRLVTTAGALAVTGLVVLAAVAGAAHPADSGVERRTTPCPLATQPVGDSTIKEIRKSVRCLINEQRGVHGFGKLARNADLQQASQRHVRAMVETGCIAHRCPDEVDFDTRVEQSGYLDGENSWRYAENTGCGSSAEVMVAGWMDSLYHRTNILDPEFRDIGVGVSQQRVRGRCAKGDGTFTVVFGRRTP